MFKEAQMVKKLAILTIVLLAIGTLLSPYGFAGLFEAVLTAAVLLFVGVLLTGVFTGVGLILVGVFFIVLMALAIPLLIPLFILALPLLIIVGVLCGIVKSIARY
jgi:hypothetical protein